MFEANTCCRRARCEHEASPSHQQACWEPRAEQASQVLHNLWHRIAARLPFPISCIRHANFRHVGLFGTDWTHVRDLHADQRINATASEDGVVHPLYRAALLMTACRFCWYSFKIVLTAVIMLSLLEVSSCKLTQSPGLPARSASSAAALRPTHEKSCNTALAGTISWP